MKNIIKISAGIFIIGLLTLSLLEATLALSFLSPSLSLLPPDVVRSIYMRELRNTIQFSRDCAEFDAQLFYTLKPGTCTFENIEYSTRYDINSLGLRDDEESLRAPRIVVLGDSHVMGWGVEADETFSSELERLTGKKTLNAGISSYGTAREIRLLKERIDTSNLKFMVIQYSDNDKRENQSVYVAGELKISDEAEWNSLASKEENRGLYYPGKYSLTTAFYMWNWYRGDKMFTKNATTANSGKNTDETIRESKLFINALKQHGTELKNVKIIILEINGYNTNNSDFIKEVKQDIAVEKHDMFTKNRFFFIDTSQILKDEHYYRIDDHMRPNGHNLIAQHLARFIQ